MIHTDGRPTVVNRITDRIPLERPKPPTEDRKTDPEPITEEDLLTGVRTGAGYDC